jgi:hypothetical protein
MNGTHTARYPRYALAGLPALLVVVALGVGRLSPVPRTLAVLLIVSTWFHADTGIARANYRQLQPYREIGASLARSVGPSDVVLVHSIPSGVLGIARYANADSCIASWVGQLGQRRVPHDVENIAAGRGKVVFVKIHDVGAPAPEESWLRQHAVVVEDVRRAKARIVTFVPPTGQSSTPPPTGCGSNSR